MSERAGGSSCWTGVQDDRLAGEPIHCNTQMGIREIDVHCRIDDATLLHKAR